MPTVKKRSFASRRQSEQEITSMMNAFSLFFSRNSRMITIIAASVAALVVASSALTLKRSFDERHAAPLLATAQDAYARAEGSGAGYEKALELFRAVQKQYPSSISGAAAAYYAGNSLAALGRNEEALKEYRNFVKERTEDKLLLGLVYQRMGYVYRELGQQTEAIQAFEQADQLTGPGVATVELARLYEAAGNAPHSQKKYAAIADALPGTSWAVEAMGKVQMIEPEQKPGSQSQEK